MYCIHVAKCLNDERIRMEPGCVAAANKAEHEVNHFLRGLVLCMKDFVGKHIGHGQASVGNRS